MSATDRLREAARVLRERAHGAASVVEITDGTSITTAYRDAEGRYFLDARDGRFLEKRDNATVLRVLYEPDVDRSLADWLDVVARAVQGTSRGDVPFEDDALRVADLILGDATRWEWKPEHGWIEREVTR